MEEIAESKMSVEPRPPNIMSVELAIKRELAYRRKVDAMMLEARGKSSAVNVKPSISVARQGPSSISVGTKRKASTSGLRSFKRPPAPPPSRRPQLVYPASLACTVCQVDFSSISNLKQHSESKNHRSKMLELKQQGSVPSNPFLCSLCQAPSSSAYQLEVHLTGARHSACLNAIEDAKT